MSSRKVWAAALLWFVLHLAFYVYLGGNEKELGSFRVGIDYQEYRRAAEGYRQGEPLYDLAGPQVTSVNNYRYHPLFAALFPLWLPWPGWVVLLGLAHLAGVYVWHRALLMFGVDTRKYLWMALVAFDLLGTLFYGNVAPLLMLASGGLFLCLLTRHWALGGLLAAIIVMTKFYWMFPLVYLVWTGQYRALLRTLGVGALVLVLASLVVPFVNIRDWLVFLVTAPARYPWGGQEVMFSTTENSVYQTFARYLGTSVPISLLALALQAFVVARYVQKAVARKPFPLPILAPDALALTLAAYPTVMLVLPEMQEVILGGVLLAWLWARKASHKLTVLLTAFCILPHVLGLLSTAAGRTDLAPAVTLPIVFIYALGQWAGSLRTLPSKS